MLERIKKALSSCGCDAWEITESAERGWEFYFIRRKLDQHRAVDVKTYAVKIYKYIEDNKFLGSASGEISPTATDEEIAKTLSSLVYQASLVKNPAYTINDKKIDIPDVTSPVDVESLSRDFIEAMLSVPETETEYLNSFEIFASGITRRQINSNGVEFTCTYPSSTVEVVVNAKKADHEIEVYRFFTSGECDKEKLVSDVVSAMRYGSDRLIAQPTPKARGIDVLLSTDDAADIYRYFISRTNAAMKVRRISDYEIGKPVCEKFEGDRVTVEALSRLKNSSRDIPVDDEGAVIRDRFLIRDGVTENFWGSRQFSSYLGLEDSSDVRNFFVHGGNDPESVIRTGDYLEVVEFSDFSVDTMGGDVAGEIRLGYLHRGGKVTVVTGGSISGSLAESAPTIRFSSETVQYDRIVIPKVTRLGKLRITGVVDEN